MTLTVSDVASLSKSLSRWEFAEYACAVLVTTACAGEYVAEFTNGFTGGIEERKERLGKRSTLLLVFSLALELICLVKTNNLSGMLIGSLSDKAAAADTKAQSALEKSSLAESRARDAGTAAGEAQQKADTVAKQAEELMRKLHEAEANLSITQFLVSARYVQNPDSLTEQLKQFKGLAVILRSYAGDAEGWGLCTTLLSITRSAEMNATDECGKWSPTVPTVTQISVWGPDDKVMESLSNAISQAGRLGVSSGPYGKVSKPPTLMIFVGVKSPFAIGQTQPVKAPTRKQNKKQSAKP